MINQLERDLIAERTKHALAELARRGRTAGRLPYGYVPDAKSKQAAPACSATRKTLKVEAVRRIFAWKRRGLTLRTIAEKLLEGGYPAPRGGTWHHSAVATILANRDAYRGGYRGTSTDEASWPAIIAAPPDHVTLERAKG